MYILVLMPVLAINSMEEDMLLPHSILNSWEIVQSCQYFNVAFSHCDSFVGWPGPLIFTHF